MCLGSGSFHWKHLSFPCFCSTNLLILGIPFLNVFNVLSELLQFSRVLSKDPRPSSELQKGRGYDCWHTHTQKKKRYKNSSLI